MRGLHLLIELARRTTDEHRGSLGQISLARADAEAALAAHEEGVQNENRIATDDPAVMATLTGWFCHATRTRSVLRTRNAELDRSESVARDALRSAYVDLKRLEMARNNAARQERIVALQRDENLAEEQYSSARPLLTI